MGQRRPPGGRLLWGAHAFFRRWRHVVRRCLPGSGADGHPSVDKASKGVPDRRGAAALQLPPRRPCKVSAWP